MKKFMARYWGFEIGVYAETEGEARKRALSHFFAEIEKELEVVEMKAKTERCDICQYTYSPSNVVKENGEWLCLSCYEDKYGFGELSPEDIPF